MALASSLYHLPWNIGSYLVVFCIFQFGYLLFTAVYIFSSLSTFSTTNFLSLSISCTFTSSPKESVSYSLSLYSSMTSSVASSTIVGTPVIPVFMLEFIEAAAYLWASLNSFSTTAVHGIIFYIYTPGNSA